MKRMLFLIVFCFPFMVSAQEAKQTLRSQQPTLAELMMIEIKLNPNDTAFNNVSFDHLPVKGFPFFTADPNRPFYTVQERDSVLRRIDSLFFEVE